MSSSIAETATYGATIPGPDPGDSVTAASVRNAVGAVANRTGYLKNLAEVLGVKRLRKYASPTDLTAETTLSDGDVAICSLFFGALPGVYVYSSTSTFVADGAYVINGHSGVGRWLHGLIAGLLDAGGGTYKLSVPIANQLIAVGETDISSSQLWTGDAAYHDIPSHVSNSVAALAGDLLEVSWVGTTFQSQPSLVELRLASYDGTTATGLDETTVSPSQDTTSNTFQLPVRLQKLFTVPGNGTWRFKVQQRTTSAKAGGILARSSFITKLFRPLGQRRQQYV